MKNEANKKVVEIGSAELTELERMKLENYALKHNLVQQQLQRIVDERTAYIRQIEEDHHGFAWDEQKGCLTQKQ